MKFCQNHWDKLRAAITDRGLFHLVSGSGMEAVEKLVDSAITQQTNIQNFDPLMAAHNMIYSNALSRVGFSLMALNDDGTQKCPICIVGSHCAGCEAIAEDWINKASDGVKTYYEENLASKI